MQSGGDSNLEQCLKLLNGGKDEQKLAGLLLASKFVKGDNKDSVIKIFHALGMRFVERLLKTGAGKITSENISKDQEQAYLQLAVTIFAAFCRVSDLAALDEVASKGPIILEILMKWPEPPVSVECLECLICIAVSSEKGFFFLHETRALSLVANYICQSVSDISSAELAVKLMHILMAKIPESVKISEYAEELASLVVSVSRMFAIQQTTFKFDILCLLSFLMASDYSDRIRSFLRQKFDDGAWKKYVRVGVGTILQNRVDSEKKNLSLLLVGSMIDICGEDWLIGSMNLPDDKELFPSDRFLLLVTETSRVEVAVLLNDLGRLKFDSSAIASSHIKEAAIKRDIANAYALIENIIKLLAKASEQKDSSLSESTMLQVIHALDDSVGVVFEFLQDAKAHGITKGDDLLASIRIIARYLSESTAAYQKEFRELLGYFLSIRGDEEKGPFLSIQFLLPTLCQCTLDPKGCNALVSCEGHKQVVQYLLSFGKSAFQESIDSSLLACDILLNLLLKRNELPAELLVTDFICLLPVLVSWAEKTMSASESGEHGENNHTEKAIMEKKKQLKMAPKPLPNQADNQTSMVIAMCSTIAALMLELSDEATISEILDQQAESTLNQVSVLLIQALDYCQKFENLEPPCEEQDLYDIVVSRCQQLINTYPSISRAIQISPWIQHLLQNQPSLEAIMQATANTTLQDLLISIAIDKQNT